MIGEDGALVSIQIGSKVLSSPYNSKALQLSDPIVLLMLLERSAGV